MSRADKDCAMTEQDTVMSRVDKDCAMTEQDAVMSRADKDCAMTEQDTVMSRADKDCAMKEQDTVMSRADKDCAMTEQEAVAADELKTFCQQLVHMAQCKSVRQFRVGSSAEIIHNEFSMQELGVRTDKEDVDYMRYSVDFHAFPLNQRVNKNYKGVGVLRIYTHGVHPGYARLIEERSGEELKYLHNHRSRLSHYDEIRGPALRYRILDDMKQKQEHVGHEDALDLVLFVPIMDEVPAVHSPYWPVEASEWIPRTRCHACPSKSVIKQVVRYGCDFVGVAHKLSCNRDNENEWRFSFSMAELIIIRGWTSSQRIVYRVLRLLYKMIAQSAAEGNNETVLCTYYFKTLMLWACEERPEEFWAEDSLVHSIQKLLIEMAEWLKSKFCCNYFIRDNNMMNHLVDTDVSRDVADLYEASASRDLICMVACCAKEESLSNTLTLRSDLPLWIHRTVFIYDRIWNNGDSYQHIGVNDFSLELQTALVQELSDVYRGLACHREAAIRDAVRDKYLRRAEKHFTVASRLHQCTASTKADINKSKQHLVANFFSNYNPEDMLQSTRSAESVAKQCALHCGYKAVFSKKATCSKRILCERTIAQQSKDRQTSKVISPTASLVIYELIEQQGVKNVMRAQFYRQEKGRSPSVNASWFIAKAYLANLYFTQRHYKAARETCSDVIEVCKHSEGNQWLAEYSFPVLLSTQWTSVYDAELQALLGLCSLCAFVSNRTDARSVCLAVCPVLFVLYLKARCAFNQRFEYDYQTIVLDRSCVDEEEQSADDFVVHDKQCESLLPFRKVILRWFARTLAILSASSPELGNL